MPYSYIPTAASPFWWSNSTTTGSRIWLSPQTTTSSTSYYNTTTPPVWLYQALAQQQQYQNQFAQIAHYRNPYNTPFDEPRELRAPEPNWTPPTEEEIRRRQETNERIRRQAERNRAARDAEERDAVREGRERADRRAAADRRALALLLANLDDEQRADFERSGAFMVVGSQTGRRYRVNCSQISINIDVIGQSGRGHKLCAHMGHELPAPDHFLAQKLMLENDENAFLRIANRH